jgi:uncharacterized protein
MIKKIEALVKKQAEELDWKYHIPLVKAYALKLAEQLKADKEVVEIAALLHDIGRQRFGPENHEVTGAKETVKVLQELGYDDRLIEKVRHCVEAHRGEGRFKPRTLEAKIIANADAMAHFDTVPLLLRVFGRRMSFEESLDIVYKKIERGWNKKLTLPQAREMVKEKYEAIKIVLESNRKLV